MSDDPKWPMLGPKSGPGGGREAITIVHSARNPKVASLIQTHNKQNTISFDTPNLNFDTREPEMPKHENSQKAIFKTANFPKAAVPNPGLAGVAKRLQFACSHVRMSACSHVSMFACSHVRIFACSHIRMFACSHVRMFAYSHVRMFASLHVRTFACSHIRMFACPHVSMSACSHVRMFAYSHVRIPFMHPIHASHSCIPFMHPIHASH